ncbi:hypothetical protein BDR04DRAFT_1144481 [Suillus decipiens]|nr:hypothetical protein BDR04DRAFT_1144481 [Suillus decipiens]
MDSAWNRRMCKVIAFSGIFDSESRQPHSRCMENTRVALRQSIREMLDRRDRKNILLDGLAGVGKTSIAFTIAEEMKAAQRLAATFFFSHKHAQKAGAIIPSIAYQLALAFPRIRDDIVRAIEDDNSLLSPEKSHADQMRELVIKPLETLRFRQEPYAIIIDALDECFSSEEAARLVRLLTDSLAGPSLPFIHIIFTSRPETHIHAAIPSGVHKIFLTTRDEDTKQDVRLFLQASLDKIRTDRPLIFSQPDIRWPSEGEFEELVFKAGGLFVYAAMAINFISPRHNGRHNAPPNPKKRLELLLREKSTGGADIDQLYRQIIATSEDPLSHCRMLASIIYLEHPLPLAELQELFYADEGSLAMMLEAFSPVILNDGTGCVEIYHASLRDFMQNHMRSKQYHVGPLHANEHLARCCLDFITRQNSIGTRAIIMSHGVSDPYPYPYPYPYQMWYIHLDRAYPSSELRDLLVLFSEKTLRHWVQTSCIPERRNYSIHNCILAHGILEARNCLSLGSGVRQILRLYGVFIELVESLKSLRNNTSQYYTKFN